MGRIQDLRLKAIYSNMYKPAFVFDGRNILDRRCLNCHWFSVERIEGIKWQIE
jgi:hypothetical protein